MRVFHSSPSRCRPLERTTAARTSLFGHRTVRHQSPANAPSPKHSAGDASTAQPWSLTSLREKLIGSGPRSSPTGATLRSRWPRLRCRDRCSVADCPAPSIAPRRHERPAGPEMRQATTAEVCVGAGKTARFSVPAAVNRELRSPVADAKAICRCPSRSEARSWPRDRRNPANAGSKTLTRWRKRDQATRNGRRSNDQC